MDSLERLREEASELQPIRYDALFSNLSILFWRSTQWYMSPPVFNTEKRFVMSMRASAAPACIGMPLETNACLTRSTRNSCRVGCGPARKSGMVAFLRAPSTSTTLNLWMDFISGVAWPVSGWSFKDCLEPWRRKFAVFTSRVPTAHATSNVRACWASRTSRSLMMTNMYLVNDSICSPNRKARLMSLRRHFRNLLPGVSKSSSHDLDEPAWRTGDPSTRPLMTALPGAAASIGSPVTSTALLRSRAMRGLLLAWRGMPSAIRFRASKMRPSSLDGGGGVELAAARREAAAELGDDGEARS
mmetsp:Transcript_60441/g.197826  ORF Transcript_60441/g.197826 Transcript_60441/m.197826 type:complete len:301 (-) Transcript_60441:3051-3953(-)